jgi:hypothetical protein
MPTNQSEIFRHPYSVSFVVENDKGGMVAKRRQVTYLYAIKAGQDDPRKPKFAKVFTGKDEIMDDCIHGLKKRKRAEDEVNKTISATTNQASIDYYDTSYWNSGRQKYICSTGWRVGIGLSGKTNLFFASSQLSGSCMG